MIVGLNSNHGLIFVNTDNIVILKDENKILSQGMLFDISDMDILLRVLDLTDDNLTFIESCVNKPKKSKKK
jgi:hypothetical protein